MLSPMPPRTRPIDCCAKPTPCAPLPARSRTAIVGLLRALADPTRLEIFRLIAAQDAALCACDVVARFDLGQPTISHHLRVLREAGLVDAERRGIWTYFTVRPGAVEALRSAVESLSPAEARSRP
jgi:ArsR family transcriptional regulator, arsenate/arsenite/antimonite-responsive transcriptional repressor